ncbi:MAG: glycoside hydrolase family 9 protein [Paludibacteraceae bacterium]|nr:glycoside hydrolase family 9 protein [Paludibacteraceae bacterium]
MKKVVLKLCVAMLCSLSQVAYSQGEIRVNQIGYCQDSPKWAMVADIDAKSVTVCNANDGKVVLSNVPVTKSEYWKESGENIQWVDFSALKTPGRYFLQIGKTVSFPFEIKQNGVYDEISLWSLKAFYLWRSSTEIPAKYATFKGVSFARQAGHPDTEVLIHKSAASEKLPEGKIVSAPKGWYDAGDYNKYVVNAGITVHNLALAYEMYPDYFKKLDLNIPESNDNVPDILNELMWEYEWLLAMQDPNDGGVYCKLSTLRFCGMVQPHEDRQPRYMIGKTTTSALDFAAVMAAGARIFADYEKEFPGFSKKALDAAVRAWNWAEKYPDIKFDNPSDVWTGSYSDDYFEDERLFAAAELFVTTKDKKYFSKINFMQKFEMPTWRYVAGTGLMTLFFHLDKLPLDAKEKAMVESKYLKLADEYCELANKSAGRYPVKKFDWGSNGEISTVGAFLGLAYRHQKDASKSNADKYKMQMLNCFDYLLGVNATNYCFLSGFGSKSPRNQHDRRNESDNIDEPIPGYLSGGVATGFQNRDCGMDKYPSTFPAKAYYDGTCSFSTNEIAINWNAPFVLLTTIIQNEFCK